MNEEYRTPYTTDALSVENGTQPEEIQAFVKRRVLSPIQYGEKVVWNFNNHQVNHKALERQAKDLMYDDFVIPFQASGVWGYMTRILPDRIREAEVLVYNQHQGTYNPYPNYFRHTEDVTNDSIRDDLTERLDEIDV